MKVGIAWGNVASNIGDLAINQGLVALLRRSDPALQYSFALLNPSPKYLANALESMGEQESAPHTAFVTRPQSLRERNFGIPELESMEHQARNPEAFLGELGLVDADTIIFNPGEHLHTHPQDIRIDLLWRLLPAIAARALGKRVIIPPVTLGPFRDPDMHALMNAFIEVPDALAIREPRSQVHFRSLRRWSRVPVLPDVAFLLDAEHPRRHDSSRLLTLVVRLDNYGLRVGGPRSSQTLREARGSAFRQNLAFRQAFAAATAYLASDASAQVQLVVQTAADVELSEAILDELVKTGHGEQSSLVHAESIDHFMNLLSQSSHVFTSRFHTSILATLSGTPTLGGYFSEHGHKMPGLYDMFGRPEWCLNLSSLTPELVGNQVAQFAKTEGNLDSALRERIARLRDEEVRWMTKSLTKRPQRWSRTRVASVLDTYLTAVSIAKDRAQAHARDSG